MITLLLITASLLICAAFISGIFTGSWLTRKLREIVEVPKIITTEKVVVKEAPVVVQVPVAGKRQDNGGLVAMGQPNKHMIADPVQRAQVEHTQRLLDSLGGAE